MRHATAVRHGGVGPSNPQRVQCEPVDQAKLFRIQHNFICILHRRIDGDAPLLVANDPSAMFAAGTRVAAIAVIPTGCGICKHVLPPRHLSVFVSPQLGVQPGGTLIFSQRKPQHRTFQSEVSRLYVIRITDSKRMRRRGTLSLPATGMVYSGKLLNGVWPRCTFGRALS